MNELEEKKKRFKLLLEGKYVPKEISIEEAKKRLRETDPNIDISNILKFFRNSQKDKLLKELLIEFVTNPELLSYYMPFIKEILKVLIK